MPATKEKLTKNQSRILHEVSIGPRTAKQVASWLGNTTTSGSVDAIYASLRRLEDRELVRRLDRDKPMRWELTRKGRKAIA